MPRTRRNPNPTETIFRTYPWNLFCDVIGRDDVNRVNYSQFIHTMDEALTDKELDVLRKMYQDGMTLEEVGDEYGVSKQWILKVQKRAEARLRECESEYMTVTVDEYLAAEAKIAELKGEILRLVNQYPPQEQECQLRRMELKKVSLEDLNLSGRAYNVLKRMKAHDLYDVSKLSKADIAHMSGVGSKTVKSIADACAKHGVDLLETNSLRERMWE